MAKHTTGTRAEWRKARLELLEAEKELTRRGDELALRRQALPWVRLEKEYRFDTDAGPASLKDLFQAELMDVYDAEHRIVKGLAKLAKTAHSPGNPGIGGKPASAKAAARTEKAPTSCQRLSS